MKVMTSDLTGPALDWAVAKCEGVDMQSFLWAENQRAMDGGLHYYNYSVNWLSGGPIIEREKISVEYFPDGSYEGGGMWLSYPCHVTDDHNGDGPTALIAAMRCFVASKLGDEVEVPDTLR